MILKIKESCEVENLNGSVSEEKIREYLYEVDGKNIIEAINNMNNNFDCDNIIWSHDRFKGSCLDSEIISIKIYKE